VAVDKIAFAGYLLPEAFRVFIVGAYHFLRVYDQKEW